MSAHKLRSGRLRILGIKQTDLRCIHPEQNMQRRTFLKSVTGALLGAALAACGGAHDGSADLEPDPQAAPVRVEVDRSAAAAGKATCVPGSGTN